MAAAVTVAVGHQVNMSIVYLDQNDAPMVTTPVPDAPPSWTDAQNPAGDMTLVVAADSNSAVETAVAAGGDVVSLALSVGGVAFAATQPITISPAPQVLTSVDIVSAVV